MVVNIRVIPNSKPEPNYRIFLLVVVFFIPGIIFSQSRSGRVISGETGSGIGFVNIGVIGRNIGTVSDKDGYFTISLDNVNDNDSLRFSIIGYNSRTFIISQFKANSGNNVYLNPRSYDLPEINITYHKPRKTVIGSRVETQELRSGFSNNDLGSELGIRVNVKKKVILKDINLNVAVCTYDSVTFRLNIYLVEDQVVCSNILTRPIYLSFPKENIGEVITFDLSEYSIVVAGDILIALELYKDMGEGKLLFKTEFFTGLTYHRKTSQGTWTKSSGVIGMYLNAQVIN